MDTQIPVELTLDAFLNWLLENTQNATIADILESVDEAGQRAVELVNANPMTGPYFDELVFDKVYYYLRDKLGVFVSKSVETDTGVESYCASKVEGGKPCYYGDTEAQAIANFLRHEHPPV